GAGDRSNRFLCPIGYQSDVGSRGKKRQSGDFLCKPIRHTLLGKLRPALVERLPSNISQDRFKRCFHRFDSGSVMRNDASKPALKIDMAKKPDDAIEQKVLYGRIERELQLSGNFG